MKYIIYTLLILFISHPISAQEEENRTIWTSMWSPDGKYIAVGGSEGMLYILDSESLETLSSYSVDSVILSRVKWHPFENKLAVVTQSTTFKAKILDLDSGEWIVLEDLISSFRAVDWNFDGSLLAISEFEDYVSIYNKFGKRITRFKGDEKGVADLDWHHSENKLITVGSQIGIYSINGSSIDTIMDFMPFDQEYFFLCIEWHPSGEFFSVGDYGESEKAENKSITFWDLNGNEIFRNTQSPVEYRNIRWNGSGSKLASATNKITIYDRNGEIINSSPSYKDYFWGVDWNPNGSMIVSSSAHGKVIIWNTEAKIIKQKQF